MEHTITIDIKSALSGNHGVLKIRHTPAFAATTGDHSNSTNMLCIAETPPTSGDVGEAIREVMDLSTGSSLNCLSFFHVPPNRTVRACTRDESQMAYTSWADVGRLWSQLEQGSQLIVWDHVAASHDPPSHASPAASVRLRGMRENAIDIARFVLQQVDDDAREQEEWKSEAACLRNLADPERHADTQRAIAIHASHESARMQIHASRPSNGQDLEAVETFVNISTASPSAQPSTSADFTKSLLDIHRADPDQLRDLCGDCTRVEKVANLLCPLGPDSALSRAVQQAQSLIAYASHQHTVTSDDLFTSMVSLMNVQLKSQKRIAEARIVYDELRKGKGRAAASKRRLISFRSTPFACVALFSERDRRDKWDQMMECMKHEEEDRRRAWMANEERQQALAFLPTSMTAFTRQGTIKSVPVADHSCNGRPCGLGAVNSAEAYVAVAEQSLQLSALQSELADMAADFNLCLLRGTSIPVSVQRPTVQPVCVDVSVSARMDVARAVQQRVASGLSAAAARPTHALMEVDDSSSSSWVSAGSGRAPRPAHGLCAALLGHRPGATSTTPLQSGSEDGLRDFVWGVVDAMRIWNDARAHLIARQTAGKLAGHGCKSVTEVSGGSVVPVPASDCESEVEDARHSLQTMLDGIVLILVRNLSAEGRHATGILHSTIPVPPGALRACQALAREVGRCVSAMRM